MMRLTSLLLTIFLTACASPAIEPNYYLLRSTHDLTTRTLEPSTHFALGEVHIAPYIDQRGLLIETSEGDMRPANQNLWAEPLYDGIRAVLLTEISHAKGEDILTTSTNTDTNPATTRIEVRIDQLHGTHDGKARLVAYWWLKRDGKIEGAYQYAEYRALLETGYSALTHAENYLLSDLAKHIAKTLVDPT